MASCFSCFGKGASSVVPPDHTDLSREELKALYEKSISLNGGRLIVHGIFARADTKNNNKRVYPKAILKREVEKFEREHISKGTALGELDHPNYASRYFKCLNLPNISHQVLEVEWKGGELWGSIEILPTPSGLLLWELYSQGIKLGVSSRGWASLRTDPRRRCVYVDDDFELITFDFVTEPSTKGAFLVPIWKAYKKSLPSQSKSVQVSHLGHGVCSLENIMKLPSVNVLASRINELQSQPGPVTDSIQASKLSHLDSLLLYSHYIVFQDFKYLDREKHARDFHSHLAMFATRAHLSNQVINKSELNSLIMQEIAKDEINLKDQAASMRLSPSIGNIPPPEGDCGTVGDQGAKQRFTDAECQGQLVDDLGSWSLHPSALPISSVNSHQVKPALGQFDAMGLDPGSKISGSGGKLQAIPSWNVAGGTNKVHPSENRVGQSQGQGGTMLSTSANQVAVEFQLIRATLARYGAKYHKQQQALQSELGLSLPLTLNSITLRGAQAR